MKSVATGQSPNIWNQATFLPSNPQDPENNTVLQTPNKSEAGSPSQRIVTFSKIKNQYLNKNQSEPEMFDHNFSSFSNLPGVNMISS